MNQLTVWAADTLSLLRYGMRSPAVRVAGGAALAAALLFTIIALAWWWPARHHQAGLQQDIDARRAAAVDAARAAEVVRAENEARQAAALLEKKLSASASQTDLIRGIAQLATRHKVRVVAQAFDEGRGQRTDGALYMDVGLLGNYAALRGMLGDLTTLPIWIEVVEARFDHADGEAPIRAQLRLLTYRAARTRP